MVLAPLRASRDALAPYVANIQDGYDEAEHFARMKAHALVRHPPTAVRLLGNRYVLLSLAAGACLFAANRLRRWRANGRPRPSSSRAQRTLAKTPARKSARTHVRTARVH
jgi:hypothetical protein